MLHPLLVVSRPLSPPFLNPHHSQDHGVHVSGPALPLCHTLCSPPSGGTCSLLSGHSLQWQTAVHCPVTSFSGSSTLFALASGPQSADPCSLPGAAFSSLGLCLSALSRVLAALCLQGSQSSSLLKLQKVIEMLCPAFLLICASPALIGCSYKPFCDSLPPAQPP